MREEDRKRVGEREEKRRRKRDGEEKKKGRRREVEGKEEKRRREGKAYKNGMKNFKKCLYVCKCVSTYVHTCRA